MPAEWEHHEATWLSWPHNEETWPGRLPAVEEVYLQMLEGLLPGEKVNLLVNDEKERDHVQRLVSKRGISVQNLVFHLIRTVDAWMRDYSPQFVCRTQGGRREVAALKWGFNAWGGKYASLAEDDRAGELIAPLLPMPVYRPGLIMEGGSLDTNGRGTLLTTEQCLLHPNRNPQFSREQIEEKLRDFLGFTHFIWLGKGIEGDDTDGHIDDITRFVNPATVVTALETNSADPNSKILDENLKRLKASAGQDGEPLNIIPVPMPDPVSGPGGRMPASYLNFYIANQTVLVPVFGSTKDEAAMKILSEIFPKRRVIGIRSEILVQGLGAIHCITHEQPAGGDL